MRKKLLLFTISIFMLTISALAQNVGINSTGASPDASAGLDVSFTDKGVLTPRVNITNLATAAPVTSPATSLLVYNTNTTTGPGYFYWDGSKWVKLFDVNDGKPWLLTGNTGTTAGTNFLGTTDNVSLSFKTNNSERMRILNSGNIGIGTTAPSYKLHVTGDIYANGGWLRVSGSSGLYFQSYGGGFYMTDATWIRTYNNKSFYHNTGTMRTDGTFQVGSSGSTLNVPNGGNFAYRTNVLFANTSGNVGIGTTAPAAKLHVNGSFRLSNGTQSNGRVLTSDANGTATWQDLSSNTYGTNNQGVSGTTDITMNTTTFTDMSQMTITFTPIHSVVYVYFTFAAYADPTVYPMEYVDYKILRDGTNMGGGNCLVEDYDDQDGIVTSFNGAMSLAVSVTPGTSTTIKVQWRRDGNYTSEIYCNSASEPDYSHRSLIIVD